MTLTNIQLLSECANFTLYHNNELEQQLLEQLQKSGATRLVNGLRMLRFQRACSLLECSRSTKRCSKIS